MHAWRLAKQYVHVHVDRFIAEQGILDDELQFFCCDTQHRRRASFTSAETLEKRQRFWRNRNHVTLLRLVAPDFSGRHPRLFGVHSP